MKNHIKICFLSVFCVLSAFSLFAVDNAGPSFITGTKGPVAKDRIRVTRTCDMGPLAMSFAVCPLDNLCTETGSLQNGQSQDFAITDSQSYSVKGFNFTAGVIFTPCRAFKGQEVEIYKAQSMLGVDNCFCRTKVQ